MIPGEIITVPGVIELNAGLDRTDTVGRQHWRSADPGRQPLSFRRDQSCLTFDRVAARGMRLDIPAGTAVRFEPGQTREVTLVPYRGSRVVSGFPRRDHGRAGLMARISRAAYADMFGPTTGDRVRLADTELFVQVERDLTTLRRRGEVRRRQSDPRRHGPVAGIAGRRCGRYGDHQRADHRSLGHREGRYRHLARPDRRRSAKPETPISSRMSTSSSVRAPRSSPAKARS